MKSAIFTFLIIVGNFGYCFAQTSEDDGAHSGTIKVKRPVDSGEANFSPNGDGVGDIFQFYFNNMSDISVVIFDSSEKIVFRSDKVDAKWDGNNLEGKPSKDGLYYYVVSATGNDSKDYKQQGEINLKR